MRRRPVTTVLAGVIAVILLGVGGVTAANTTLARFSDNENGGTSTAAAATVVLGGQRTATTLPFTGLTSGTSGTKTVNLSVVYKGSVPATIQLQLPSGATATNCVRSGTTYADPLLYRTLTITLGGQAAVPYCSLLDGVARTLVATVQPGTTTVVPITVSAGGLLSLIGRSEAAPIAIRAVGGFTDVVTGTIQITANGLINPNPAPLPAPAGTTSPAAARSARTTTAVATPQECTDAGLGPFTEAVALTAARPRFVAAEDRPGTAGPFLVLGTDADDTVTGSAAGDCLVGGGGADTIDGLGGGDVLLGGDGDDRIDGGPGDDVLRGAAGADRLTGGAGADLIDGGGDGAVCDIGPEDEPGSSCGAPVVEAPTAVPTSTVPTATVVPTTAPAPVTSAAPVAPTTTEAVQTPEPTTTTPPAPATEGTPGTPTSTAPTP
jgi:Ca2+-binding RTX toxin-like protein